MDSNDDRIVIENVNVPGSTTRVSRAMYEAMRQAMWKVLPATAPGLTQSEIRDAVVPHLPQDHLQTCRCRAGQCHQPANDRGAGYGVRAGMEDLTHGAVL